MTYNQLLHLYQTTHHELKQCQNYEDNYEWNDVYMWLKQHDIDNQTGIHTSNQPHIVSQFIKDVRHTRTVE